MTDSSTPLPPQHDEPAPESGDVPPAEHVPHGVPTGAPAHQASDEAGWQRLSPRKMLIDPVKAIGSMIVPAIAAIVGLSSLDGLWWLLAVPVLAALGVVFGVLPWLTTWYRVSDTQLQLRSGILSKNQSTAPVDRIRSVDLEATLLHRVFGLRKVSIGTGVDSEQIELDAVTEAEAAELRSRLLTQRSTVQRAEAVRDDAVTAPPLDDAATPVGGAAVVEPEPGQERLLAQIDWSWLRFAPFNLGRLVIVAGALGALSQIAPDDAISGDQAEAAWDWLSHLGLWMLILSTAAFVVVGWLAISIIGYVVQWWGLRLTREHGSLHLTSGLFTTRAISVEEKRVRGVQLTEPALLRLVGGADLKTMSTGVEDGTTSILPQCPVDVARAVATDVLDDPTPMAVELVSHGPAARRRWHVRQQWTPLFILALGAVLTFTGLPSWADWFPVWTLFALGGVSVVIGVFAAESGYAHQGHALTDDHLVVGSGVFARVRTALESDGIIGWVVEQSFFQRRLGLATLVATTAAGNERVDILDIPLDLAVALMHASTPEPVARFLVEA